MMHQISGWWWVLLVAGAVGISVLPMQTVPFEVIAQHFAAVQGGRSLRGFPPAQLRSLSTSAYQGEMEARAALEMGVSRAERQRLEGIIERAGLQRAQARQELLLLELAAHPLPYAVVCLSGVVFLLSLQGIRRKRKEDRVLTHLERLVEERVDPAFAKRKGDRGRIPQLHLPSEEGATSAQWLGIPERTGSTGHQRSGPKQSSDLLKTPQDSENPRKVPAKALPVSLARFFHQEPRDFLGLLAFLSEQAGLHGASAVRLYPGARDVQVFLVSEDHEREIGLMPRKYYPQMVAELSERLHLDKYPQRWIVPAAAGYQLQEVRLTERGLELEVLEWVHFTG